MHFLAFMIKVTLSLFFLGALGCVYIIFRVNRDLSTPRPDPKKRSEP